MLSRLGGPPPRPVKSPARPPVPAARPGMARRASTDSRHSDIVRMVHRATRDRDDESSITVLWAERLFDKLEAWWKKKVAKWKGRPVGG